MTTGTSSASSSSKASPVSAVQEVSMPQSKFRLGSIWPLSPITALVLLASVLPSYCFLNRGFTQWFHWVAVYYLLTQWQFLERFLILCGLSVCLGWYASLIYEYVQHDRFCHPLYKNMPSMLMQYYWIPVDVNIDTFQRVVPLHGLDFESATALVAMVAAHLLDFVAHPLLTYYFWRRHSTRKGGSIKQVLTWPVIVSSYLYSRLWSLTHTKYNTGSFGLWYIGFDIYEMDCLDSWYPAYIAESCIYAMAVIWKLWETFVAPSRGTLSKSSARVMTFETKPNLLLSESCVSIDSQCESIETYRKA